MPDGDGVGSESRVRENRMHGSIGGCWGGNHDPGRDGRETLGPAPDAGILGGRTSGLPHKRRIPVPSPARMATFVTEVLARMSRRTRRGRVERAASDPAH
jgi:hypothetical protein